MHTLFIMSSDAFALLASSYAAYYIIHWYNLIP